MIRISIATLLASTSIAPAFAQATANAQESETILVVGQRDLLALEARTQAGSRLPLTARETPASVEVITQDELQLRAPRTAREAFNEVVGAISGNVPGNPTVISLRGFSGNAVSILQDWVSTSTVVQRDSNTWHYDRIEVLKGPASVPYREGALAGVINKVNRKPTLDGRRLAADGLVYAQGDKRPRGWEKTSDYAPSGSSFPETRRRVWVLGTPAAATQFLLSGANWRAP